jgi:outer membrane lipoprotein-sorting protein
MIREQIPERMRSARDWQACGKSYINTINNSSSLNIQLKLNFSHMKKLIFIFTGLALMSVLGAQSLQEIVNKYTAANKLDKVSSLKTIQIAGNMSMGGMQLPVTMWMKNPNKIKILTDLNGQSMIQVYDGIKGYTVNPMTGSSSPVAMSAEEVEQTLRANMFQNYMATYLKKGQLGLEGEEKVKDKPSFKLKATNEDGTVIYFFIDKSSYLMSKISTKASQGGMTMTIEIFPSDYTETNGFILPMKTTTTAQGMEIEMQFTKVEVDNPMDDSIFKIN